MSMPADQGVTMTGESLAPPVPRRNPHRNNHHYQAELASLRSHCDGQTDSSSLPATEIILEELNCDIDTLDVTKDGRSLGNNNTVKLTSNDAERVSSDVGHVYYASSRTSLTDALKQDATCLDLRVPADLQGRNEQLALRLEPKNATSTIQANYGFSESLTTISSYDGASRRMKTAEEQKDNARVEDWLDRGMLVAPKTPLKQSSLPKNCDSEKRSTISSVTTSKSSGKDKRSCTSPLSPLSPLGNGRDVYGNYIPTNTQDYFTARSPSSPALPMVVEHVISEKKSFTPHLRGGGGWWNPLSGKESSLKEKLSNSRPGSSHQRTPIPTLTANLKETRGTMPVRRGEGTTVTQDDWSDESDQDVLRTLMRQSNQSNFNAQGQDRSFYRKQRDQPRETVIPPLSDYLERTESSMQRELEDSRIGTSSVQNSFVGPRAYVHSYGEDVRSQVSVGSQGTRTRKRWNIELPSGPPTELASPPPTPLRSTAFAYQASRNETLPKASMSQVERLPSPPMSYIDEAWDLQSLQFGESVSVAGVGRQQSLQGPVRRQHPSQMTSSEFVVLQRRGQFEFRPLCQDIMARYNAEISKIERAQGLNEISTTQYRMQRDWNISNMNKALAWSADISGYMILKEESAILEAMKTPDGWAIYHDMLHTTRPEMWQRLSRQHFRVSTAPVSTQRPRGSSFTQARHVAGKFARLILAAPSDPELKTYSNSKPPDGRPVRVSSLRTNRPDDKGKSVSSGPVSGEGVDAQDFAPSRTDVAPLKSDNSDTRWTGTTFVPQSSVRLQQGAPQPQRIVSPTPQPQHALPRSSLSAPRPSYIYNNVAGHGETRSSLSVPRPSYVRDDISGQGESTLWPEGDSQGNWFAGKKGLRGGGGEEKRKRMVLKKVRGPKGEENDGRERKEKKGFGEKVADIMADKKEFVDRDRDALARRWEVHYNMGMRAMC